MEQSSLKEKSKKGLPVPPLRPDPNYFLRKGEGNYASRNNRIMLLQGEQNNLVQTDPRAFLDYGMSANQMAQVFDINNSVNKNKRNYN